MRWILMMAGFLFLACTSSSPTCARDNECGPRGWCIAGACQATVTCTSDTQCAAPERCQNGACLLPGRCHDDGTCRLGERCVAGLCAPSQCQAGQCPEGLECDLATRVCAPAPCGDASPCRGGLRCDPVTGRCRLPQEIATPETCNGIDDDLNGVVDDPFVSETGQACTVGVGACRREGVNRCAPDGSGVRCSAEAGAASEERCNGIDDDCDGVIDDGFELGPCTAGLGACAAGQLRCRADGSGTECVMTGPGPGREVCNGIDDDCDGVTDEPWNPKSSCHVQTDGGRLDGVERCRADGSGTECVTLGGE